MAQSFGRRAAAAAPVAPPSAGRGAPTPADTPADPRLQALAEVARQRRAPGGREPEFGDYIARRQAAIGPWRILAYTLTAAPPAAAFLLGVHGLWLAPITGASLLGPRLLKRARLRWADELTRQTSISSPPTGGADGG